MYRFVDLTEGQRHDRRLLLDRFALLAQASAIAPLVAVQICFAMIWIQRKRRDASGLKQRHTSPSSPHVKHEEALTAAQLVNVKFVANHLRWVAWWLGEDIPILQSTRGEVLLSAGWAAWLLILCFVQTGDDYMHVTKRFGIIPASQLPMHYLLSLKTPYSPVSLLTCASHESLISVHQHLGRVITLLFTVHVALYTNFFVISNLLAAKLTQAYIISGYLAFIAFVALGTTALTWVRQHNYRLFYTTHVTLSIVVLPALWVHVYHIRIYIYETLAIYLLNITLRFYATRTHKAQITLIPSTQSIVEITIPSPQRLAIALETNADITKSRDVWVAWQAGHHAYIGLASPRVSLLSIWNRGNPFTLASVPHGNSQSTSSDVPRPPKLTFIARVLKGSTARFLAQEGQTECLLTVEGPYGLSSHSDRLLQYDRVLLVAGGVGGTFCVPLYRQLLNNLSPSKGSRRRSKVSFLWTVKDPAEVMWALPHENQEREGFIERLQVCTTGNQGLSHKMDLRAGFASKGADNEIETEDCEGIELEERKNLLQQQTLPDDVGVLPFECPGLRIHSGRPDLVRTLEQLFNWDHSERVAIIVCGPKSLTRPLKKEAGRYVKSGREVYFWEERFAL